MKYFYMLFLLLVITKAKAQKDSDTTWLDKTKTIYAVYDTHAEVKGGMEAYTKWIKDNISQELKTPEGEPPKKVFVRFDVMADGTVVNPFVMKGAGMPYDSVAVSLIKKHPAEWRPATTGKNRKPVNSYFVMPVVF